MFLPVHTFFFFSSNVPERFHFYDKIAWNRSSTDALTMMSPSHKPLIGMWDLVYTTTSGSSGGKLGPFIGKVQQEVDIAEGLYVNYVRLGPLTGRLDATWEVINQKQWKVGICSRTFYFFARRYFRSRVPGVNSENVTSRGIGG